MRLLRAGVAALCLAAATAACSGSGNDTGSEGGWRVSGAHIRIVGEASRCSTPAPALDTFSATPTPQPGCSPPAQSAAQASAEPESSAAPHRWQSVHVENYHTGSSQWHPIYTTYTAPPGSGISAPLVHATNQPMPTPYVTPTPFAAAPSPMASPTLLPTAPPEPTTPPAAVTPSATP